MEEFEIIIQTFLDDGGIPKPLLFLGFVASNILTAWATRSTSKDKKNYEILTKGLKRQSELDAHQRDLMKEMKEEVRRLKDIQDETREELKERKEDNIDLYEKNQRLLSKIGELELLLDRQEYECEKIKKRDKS